MTENEKLLLDVLDLLEGSSFQYWISQGTLLGLVRENRILPWDHDIDISVWDHEVSKQEIIDIFIPHGFEVEYVPGDDDCIHFRGREKNVDIGFHKVKDSIAHIQWVMPGESLSEKVCQFILSLLDDKYTEKDVSGRGLFVKKLVFKITRAFTRLSPSLFRHLHKSIKQRHGNKCFHYLGYSYPVSLLEKQGKLTCFEREMPVPADYEKVLELTYGEDWRTPRKDYVWYEEAGNLL